MRFLVVIDEAPVIVELDPAPYKGVEPIYAAESAI